MIHSITGTRLNAACHESQDEILNSSNASHDRAATSAAHRGLTPADGPAVVVTLRFISITRRQFDDLPRLLVCLASNLRPGGRRESSVTAPMVLRIDEMPAPLKGIMVFRWCSLVVALPRNGRWVTCHSWRFAMSSAGADPFVQDESRPGPGQAVAEFGQVLHLADDGLLAAWRRPSGRCRMGRT